jgi:plasmid maintenance system antidote protein VapI
VLGTTAQYWLNLQNAVDLHDAAQRLRTDKRQPRRMEAFETAA